MSYPHLTIDTFTSILLSTIIHPFPAILLPLTHLSISPTSFHDQSSYFYTLLYFYTLPILLLNILSYLDAVLAYSSYGVYGQPRKLDWSSEVVVITGGTGGLGRMLAERFGRRGVAVAVLDVKGPDDATAEEWAEWGIRWYSCDVGDRSAVKEVAERVRKELGTPSILINNAAIAHSKPFLELSPQEVDSTYRVNVLSHYHSIQTFLPDMLKRPAGGTIVTVSSVLGQLGCAGLSDYTSSKAAITTLHTSLLSELRILSKNHSTSTTSISSTTTPSPISLLLLHPGHLSTPLFKHIPSPPLSHFLGPIVSASLLATRIIEEIDSGKSGEIALPMYARWVGIFGLLPPGLRGLVRGVVGVDWAGWEGALAKKNGAGKGI